MGRFMSRFIKIAALTLAVSLCAGLLCACGDDTEQTVIPADYGTYGADIARQLAGTYSNRTAYSQGEQQAGEFVQQAMKDLGYEPQVQTFTNSSGLASNNYVVKIEGTGFYSEGADGSYSLGRKIAVIGAHYDAAMRSDLTGSTFDGISDNASGVGCLLTALAQASSYKKMGFDVYYVAFGAGTDSYAGANAFLNSLSVEDRSNVEVMYCIDSIYAGDKVYASAGYNSLVPGSKYAMRRKLYQTYDVCYANTLYSTYGFDILYNESGIETDLNGDGNADIYNEVSANKSDYVPFDDAGIPIVFFDSYDYNFESMDEMKDTKNLTLQDYGGAVRSTPLDSTSILDAALRTEDTDEDGDGVTDKSGDVLQIRINAIAFVIMETLMKGSEDGMTPDEYQTYINNPTESTLESGVTETTAD